MAGLRHTREDAKGASAQQPLRESVDKMNARSMRSQPLGVILFCRRKRLLNAVDTGDAAGGAQEAVKAITELERRVKSRVYRVYACEDGPEGRWEYFAVLEFGDLQAWNVFEQNLEKNGFGTLFEWEVRAFGRGL